MKLIVNSLCLSSLLAVIAVIRCEENFGNTAFCGGSKQSPIDIRTKDLTLHEYEDLQWSKEYAKTPDRMTATGGGSLTIGSEYSNGAVPRIRGGPLSMPYKLVQFHFHWAQKDSVGSEHRVNGHKYLMEMHAVHIKENLTFEQAGQDKSGIAVVGYFFEYSSKPSHALAHIIDTFPDIHTANRTAPVQIPRPFPINELLRPISCNYVTYKGSLTTPPCSENVRWIVSPFLNSLSDEQMLEFRTLANDNRVNKDNYRNLQKRNNRKIYYAVENEDSHVAHDYPTYEDPEVKKGDDYYGDVHPSDNDAYVDDKAHN